MAGTFSVWGTSLIDKFKSDMERNPEKWEYLGDRSESRDKQYMAAGGISHRYFFNSDASLKTTVAAVGRRRFHVQSCVGIDSLYGP